MASTIEKTPTNPEKSSDNGEVEVDRTKSETALGAHSVNPDDFGFSEAEQKAIIRRVDIRLVITVGAMYCVSLMDRTNLGAANIAGMQAELNLVGNQYVSLSSSLFW
jgi:hypothetical protein